MATTYDDAFAGIRRASELMDEALTEDGERRRARIRVAFYQLYQAANLAAMIAPGFAMEQAMRSEDYAAFSDVLFRRYFKEELYPVDDAREVFDRWAQRVRRFVERLSAQSKLAVHDSATEDEAAY